MKCLLLQVQLPEEDHRGGQRSRGHQKVTPVLLLGKPHLLARRPLRVTMASGHRLHLRIEAVPRLTFEHPLNGGLLASDTDTKDAKRHSR